MTDLWDGIKLPVWDDEALGRLYVLFQTNQAAAGVLGRRDDDDFVRLLMCVIQLQFRSKNWGESLPKARLDPEDVGQQTVMHLRRKASAIRMDAGQGPKVMLAGMNTTIERFVLSAIAGKARKGSHEMTASDYAGETEQAEVPSPVVAPAPVAPMTESAMVQSLRQCRAAAVCDVWYGERRTSRRLYDYLVSSLVRERGIVPHAKLPDDLRKKASRELHGLVAARINRLVREYSG